MEESKVLGQKRGQQIRYSADIVSAIRFHETQRSDPLINGPFAHLFFASEAEEKLQEILQRWPFFAEYIMVRDKFFDNHLTVFCQEEGVRQVVLLGAGNDMRASRLPFLKEVRVFEVDLPDQMALKKSVLQKAGSRLPEQVAYVGASVIEPGFMQLLMQAGFNPAERSAFIIEGLIYYLRPAGVDHLFEELSSLPSLGNLFLIDHISVDFSQKALDPERRGKPFYPVDLSDYLSERGFSIRESALLGNLTEKYYGKSHKEKWWVVAALK
jgi:methyltransferase (TIGR00027 family)